MPAQIGDVVHVYNKASGDSPLFPGEEDYVAFVSYLSEYLSPFNADSFRKEFTVKGRTFKGKGHMPKNYFGKVEIIAFALMPDHFHLALRQKSDRAIEQFMRSLSTRYSMYFNKKNNRSGPVFQGAYRSTVINETSIGPLAHYINTHKTRYSSFAEYQGKTKSDWLKKVEVENIAENTLNPDLTLEKPVQVLERIQPEKNLSSSPATPYQNYNKISARKRLQEKRVPEIISMIGVFIILFSLGLRNMTIYAVEDNNLADILGIASVETDPIEYKPSPSPPPTPTPSAIVEETSQPAPLSDATHLAINLPDEILTISIRKYPSSSTEKIAVARNGDLFEIISRQEEWYQIKLPDNSSGFIHQQYILESKNI